MPLEVYPRGSKWWVKGKVEYDGLPITGYYRKSTGSSSKQGAVEWIKNETDRQRRRYVFGEEAEQLTMGAAIKMYNAKPDEVKLLIKIVQALSLIHI